MNIAVVAREAAGVQTVRLVGRSPHRLDVVLTDDDHGAANQRGATVSATAGELGVPVLPNINVRNPTFADELRRREVDVLLNVHSLYLIHPQVLTAPRIGSFNLHPGPLPRYAGLNVPSWAIYRGESEHGVTLHWMVPRVDAGPIAFQASFQVTPQDTGLSVSAKCVQHGMPLISELLATLGEDPHRIPRIDQDIAGRSYFGKDVPHQRWIPWQSSAQQIVDFVRACDYGPWPSPWGAPRSRSRRTGVTVDVIRAARTGEPATAPPGTIGQADRDAVFVAAADEWVRISRARVDGASVQPAAAFGAGDFLEAA